MNACERHAYAVETHRRAEELWDYCFLPWRWPEWLRRYRNVKRRMRYLQSQMPAELDVSE